MAACIGAQQPDPASVEFRANSYVLNNQIRLRIAHQPDGGFIVVWDSDEAGLGDTSGWSPTQQ